MTPRVFTTAAFAWLTMAANSTGVASCNATDLALVSEMWRVAANWPACASYAKSNAVANSTEFTWPCSATDCTKIIEAMAESMPTCVDQGNTLSESEKVEAKVAACKESASASASSSSGGANVTIKPTTSVSTTSPPPTSTTKAPTKSYSSRTCSDSQISDMTSEYLATARGSDCKAFAMTGTYHVTIFAPCTSDCVTTRYESLAESIPDCFLDSTEYEYGNKRQEITESLRNCSGQTAATSLYISFWTGHPMEAVHDSKSSSTSEMKSGAVSRRSQAAWAWAQVTAVVSAFALQFALIR